MSERDDAPRVAASGRVAGKLRAVGSVVWPIVGLVILGYVAVKALALVSAIVIALGVSLLIAALLAPGVVLLQRWHVPKWLATLLVLIGALAVLGGIGFFTVNSLINNVSGLRTKLLDALSSLQEWLVNGPLGLSQQQINSLLDNALAALRDQVQVTSAAFTLASVIGGIALVIFVLVFFLYEGERLWQFLIRAVPDDVRPRADRAGHAAFRSLGSFTRATIVVAVFDAVLIGVGLAVIGVPLAIPLASLIFLGAFIPYVGAAVSGLVAILVALVSGGFIPALLAAAVVAGVQFLEGNLLQPLIMGKAVRLHPVAVILAVSVGLTVWGIAGALLAVPILVVVRELITTR